MSHLAENRPSDVQIVIDSTGQVVPLHATLSMPFSAVKDIVESSPAPRRPNRNKPVRINRQVMPPNSQLLKMAASSPALQEWYDE